MRSFPGMKLFLVLAVVISSLMVAPSLASAHFLTNRQSASVARAVCRAISANENTPYICRDLLTRSRRSAHAVVYTLDIYDPNDGEECVATTRVYVRTGSRRIRASIGQGSCLIRPTTN